MFVKDPIRTFILSPPPKIVYSQSYIRREKLLQKRADKLALRNKFIVYGISSFISLCLVSLTIFGLYQLYSKFGINSNWSGIIVAEIALLSWLFTSSYIEDIFPIYQVYIKDRKRKRILYT